RIQNTVPCGMTSLPAELVRENVVPIFPVYPFAFAPHCGIHRIEVTSEHCLRKCLYESFRCFLKANNCDCVLAGICHFCFLCSSCFNAEDRRIFVCSCRRSCWAAGRSHGAE